MKVVALVQAHNDLRGSVRRTPQGAAADVIRHCNRRDIGTTTQLKREVYEAREVPADNHEMARLFTSELPARHRHAFQAKPGVVRVLWTIKVASY